MTGKRRRPAEGKRPPKPVAQEKVVAERELSEKEKRFLSEMRRNNIQDEELALFEEPVSGWWSNDWIIDQEDTRSDNP
ncbi:MAG: hypothetical protein ACYC9Q_08620 [Bacillota bacterium]